MLRYSFRAFDTLVTIIASILDFLSLIDPGLEWPRNKTSSRGPSCCTIHI